jgi:hypothetical protein
MDANKLLFTARIKELQINLLIKDLTTQWIKKKAAARHPLLTLTDSAEMLHSQYG